MQTVRSICVCGVLSAFAGIAAAEPTSDAAMAARFETMMMEFMRQHQPVGASLAVARDGKVIFARGFGLADRETGTPVGPTTRFRIASVSKPITAVAILQLEEHRKLKLDDPVFKLLKAPSPPKGTTPDPRLQQVTVRHCLQHTGGWDRARSFDPMFRSVAFAKLLEIQPPALPHDVIRCMMGQPLDFDPGARYAYSNFGYSLLGRVIEAVSGQTYEQYVLSAVLEPLGIRRMQLGKTLPGDRAPDETRYYDLTNRTGPAVLGKVGESVALPYGAFCVEAFDAHGGWIGSATDLVRFAAAFDRPEACPILSHSSIRTMFARPDGPGGNGDDRSKPYYGCGWMVRPVGAGKQNTWHTGSIPGTAALLVRRHDKLSWAVLFNTRDGANGEFLAAAVDPLLHHAADGQKGL